MGRLRKKAAGKARESRGMRRTLAYAAMTKDEAQRSIRPFYEAVIHSLTGKSLERMIFILARRKSTAVARQPSP